MLYLVLATLLIAFVGCDNTAPPEMDDASIHKVEAQPKLTVALFGDNVRVAVAKELMSDESLHIVAPSKDSPSSDIAKVAYGSDIVFLVTDATQGPLPVHREHVLMLRQLGFNSIALFFANTKELAGMADSVELLELEELEVREILNLYGLPGDTAPCFHDTKLPGTRPGPSLALGIPSTLDWLKQQTPNAKPSVPKSSSKTIDSEVYLMAQLESAHSRTFSSGDRIRIFINGQLYDGTVAAGAQLSIGSSSSAPLHFENPVPAKPGDRFIVFHKQHVIGAGAVTKLAK